MAQKFIPMTDIKLLSKNKYLKVPLFYSGTGGNVPPWRQHLQPCEYLETDGDCWINLQLEDNFSLNNFYCKIKIHSEHNGNSQGYYGWRFGPINRQFALMEYGYSYVNKGVLFGSNSHEFRINNADIIIEHNNNNVKIVDFDNNILSNYNFNESNSIIDNVALFAFFMNPNTISNKMIIGGRMYEFILKSTNVNKNIIAAYVIDEYTDNKLNICYAGVAGMVDVETGIFYTNDGTGNFSHGADIEI